MGRHGSRLPTPQDLSEILNMTYSIGNQSSVISKIQLPDELAFLKHGYKSELGHDGLTSIGRQQLFNHGARYGDSMANLSCVMKLMQMLASVANTLICKLRRSLRDKIVLSLNQLSGLRLGTSAFSGRV